MLWMFIQPLLVLALVIFLGSQMVLPPFIDKPFFWFFKKSEKQYNEVLDELHDKEVQLESKNVEKEVKEIDKKIKNKK